MNSDFKELISLLEHHGVKYVIVGAYAVMIYTEPRFTRDLDVFVSSSKENLESFRTAFAEFGFVLTDEQIEEFSKFDRMLTVGRPPIQIDVFNHIKGLDFDEVHTNCNRVDAGGTTANFLSLEDLVHSKESAGRPQDLADIKGLREALRKRNRST